MKNRLEYERRSEKKHEIARLNQKLEYYKKNRDELAEKLQFLLENYANLKNQLSDLSDQEDLLKKVREENMQYKQLIQERKNLDVKLNQVQLEHFTIKQTYDKFIKKKNDLLLIEMELKMKDKKYKNRVEKDKEYIAKKKEEIEDMKNYLENKIKDEAVLREYYEEEMERAKQSKDEFSEEENFSEDSNSENLSSKDLSGN